jgi:hypothetical protein
MRYGTIFQCELDCCQANEASRRNHLISINELLFSHYLVINGKHSYEKNPMHALLTTNDTSKTQISRFANESSQGRRLRFASCRDNYGERSEPKNFFARGG